MTLLNYIPTGRENAITRAELAVLTGRPDREVRKEIKRLVESGIPIVSSSDQPGYWMAKDIGEIKRYLRECDARERTSRRTTAKLRQYVAGFEGCEIIHVRAHERRVKRRSELEGQTSL